MNNEINELNELLAFKELQSVFDSAYAINNLQKLPYKFIAASENLYKALDDLNIDVPYVIDNMKQKLNKIEEISSYYLNDTDTSYVDVIQQAKEIMDNYYI